MLNFWLRPFCFHNTAYSDGTPSASFTYTALGQMKTVTDASGTRALDYVADGQMIAEALAFNTSLFTLHEKYDILGRNQGYALSNEVAQIAGTTQSYDLCGRLNQVDVDGISVAFTYGYLEGSHLQKTLAMPNGLMRTFSYEANRDLLTMIVHSNATDRLVQRDFTYDGLGRLIDRSLVRASGSSSSAPDAFGYNLRSELTNAVIGANAFAYNFDPIGNRLSATEFSTNTAYVASAINQYTSINPVNPVENVFNPEFDADGNQTLLRTTTGIWHVTYNAENRPILFSKDTTVVSMAYDYVGRRFEYKETVNGSLTRHERYLYRDYLQIAALDMLNSACVKHTTAWDPSEPTATRPLCLSLPTANSQPMIVFYGFDQIKNVTELFDSNGLLAATYDYSPFGQLVSFTGNISNPLKYSSEVMDEFLGLVYYNYRHFNPLDGRWVNRDMIEESGGVNLYVMSDNAAMTKYDFLGQIVTGFTITNFNAIVQEGYDGEFKFGKVEADYDCFCKPNGKYKLDIIRDTVFSGTINLLPGKSNNISGRLGITLITHEETHANNLINYAKLFDNELHAQAKGTGLSSECCNKKKEYLDAKKDYYRLDSIVNDMIFDINDYWLGKKRDNVIFLFSVFFCDREDAKIKANKAKGEMDTACANK